MKKALSIVGPTGVGKTALSLQLSRKIPSMLISADSIQVYKGLNIISGKDLPKNSQFSRVSKITDNKKFTVGFYNFDKSPVFFLDVVTPSYNFNVADFTTVARSLLDYVYDKRKLPIVVGGTGFYIHSLFENFKTINIPPDKKLRNELNKKSVLELQIIVEKINKKLFDLMNNSDRNNPQRLVRAIEVSHQSKILNRKDKKIEDIKHYDVLFIGLGSDRNELKKLISIRVESRIKHGALKEAQILFNNFKKLSSPVKAANGYKQLFEYLLGKSSFEEAVEKWKISEYRHAKNQMTYFKKYMNVKWFDIGKAGFEKKVEEYVLSWYNN